MLIKSLVDKLVSKIDLITVLKVATRVFNDPRPVTVGEFRTIIREESVTIVKEALFFYMIWMNLLFAVLGIIFGFTIGAITL